MWIYFAVFVNISNYKKKLHFLCIIPSLIFLFLVISLIASSWLSLTVKQSDNVREVPEKCMIPLLSLWDTEVFFCEPCQVSKLKAACDILSGRSLRCRKIYYQSTLLTSQFWQSLTMLSYLEASRGLFSWKWRWQQIIFYGCSNIIRKGEPNSCVCLRMRQNFQQT